MVASQWTDLGAVLLEVGLRLDRQHRWRDSVELDSQQMVQCWASIITIGPTDIGPALGLSSRHSGSTALAGDWCSIRPIYCMSDWLQYFDFGYRRCGW